MVYSLYAKISWGLDMRALDHKNKCLLSKWLLRLFMKDMVFGSCYFVTNIRVINFYLPSQLSREILSVVKV